MQGSLDTASSREKPVSLRPELNEKLPALDGHAITDERVVKNTFINDDSTFDGNYWDTRSQIVGLIEGRVITVTYFSQNRPVADTQSHVVDLTSTTKDDVHVSWTQIRNFEIRMTSEFNYEYDADSNITKTSGEAAVFPRFIPHIGDIFLYEMTNNRIGLFYISGVEALSMSQDGYHKIKFTIQQFITAEDRDRLGRQSTVIAYFDKLKYVAGNTAFLTTANYGYKKDLEHIRKEIIEDYIERFYSNEYSSFMRKDDVYDPYVVEYWNKKVSIMDTVSKIRPIQLLVGLDNYKKTLFAILTNNPIKNLNNVEKVTTIKRFNSSFWGANITALLNHEYVAVQGETNTYDETLINKNGNPIFYDPTTVYYQQMPREMADARIDRFFRDSRAWFTDKMFPDTHFKHNWYKGPYPIRSDKELEHIWRTIHGYKDDDYLSEASRHYCAGYIQWYREAYPGTLSDIELTSIWRKEHQKTDDAELSAAESEALKSYIASYRSKYSSITTATTILDRDGHLPWLYYPFYRRSHPTHVTDTVTSMDEDDLCYGLSAAFYNGDMDKMSPFEKQMYLAVTGGEIDISVIVDLVKDYKDWSDDDAFYKHLLAIYLIDTALYWLMYHS